MSDAFGAMRRGDRGALRALLETCGARMDAALAALGASDDDDAWRAAVKAVWAESARLVSLPGEEPPAADAVVVACALASAAAPLLAGGPLDAAVAARLAARVATGLAGASEQALHERQRREEPALVEVADKMRAGASSTVSGAGRAVALWPTVEPLLR